MEEAPEERFGAAEAVEVVGGDVGGREATGEEGFADGEDLGGGRWGGGGGEGCGGGVGGERSGGGDVEAAGGGGFGRDGEVEAALSEEEARVLDWHREASAGFVPLISW